MITENKLNIGTGIFTIPEISKILRLPYSKVSLWVNRYWDDELGAEFQSKYSWTLNNTKAVSFFTLVEFYVLYMLAESGVKTRRVLEAHKELSGYFGTFFPFAQKAILENIQTDGQKVFFNLDGSYLTLDSTKQFNLGFIKLFFKKIDFDGEMLASRFWPLGKEKSILIDPQRQFGHPIIGDTNIYPETLFSLYKGGDSVKFISFVYDLEESAVNDAIEFCKVA
jgi:uncharacterized protein (DUF433 family)